jgi:hypothetical protein
LISAARNLGSVGIRSRTTNPQHNLPIDNCMFSNYIRASLTCAGTLTNYAGTPLNCTRPLPNCTRPI